MNGAEQKKRRFVLHLNNRDRAIGVVCDDYSWGVFGIVFYGSEVEGSYDRHVVFGAMPGEFLVAFHELNNSQDWPCYVDRVYVEETTPNIEQEGEK